MWHIRAHVVEGEWIWTKKMGFFSRVRGCCLEGSLNFWRLHIQITRHAKAENERHMTCDTSGFVERCLSFRVCECDWLVHGFQVLNFNYTHRKKHRRMMKKVSNAQSASVSLPGVAHARQATLLMCAWHSNAGTFFSNAIFKTLGLPWGGFFRGAHKCTDWCYRFRFRVWFGCSKVMSKCVFCMLRVESSSLQWMHCTFLWTQAILFRKSS